VLFDDEVCRSKDDVASVEHWWQARGSSVWSFALCHAA